MSGRRLAAVPAPAARAVGLVRVSMVGTRGDDLTSPELQRTSIEDHARRAGYVVTEWLEAVDQSGSSARSPWWRTLDRAVEMVERGDAEVLVAWKWSRVARNRRRWAVAVDRVEVAGGRIESATEAVDVTTSTGRLTRGMLAELAAWESEVRGEVWKETHARRRAEGLPHAAVPRLGYLRDGKGYVPDPVTVPLVVELYERWCGGQGWASVADWTTSVGLLSPRTGRPWTVRGLRYTMDAGFAAGLIHTTAGTHEPGAHEAILTPALWDTYQRRRRATEHLRGAQTMPPRTPFGGLVRCSGCGGSMRTKNRRSCGWKHHPEPDAPYIYACENRDCTNRRHVTVARVEAAWLDWLEPLAHDVEARGAAALADQAEKTAARADRRSLERRRQQTADRLLAAARDHNSGLYDLPTYTALRDELAATRAQIDRELDRLAETLHRPAPTATLIRGVLADWNLLDTIGSREVARSLTARIQIHPAATGTTTSVIRILGAWEN